MVAPLKQKPITFINDASAIFDHKLLEEAVLWYAKRKNMHSSKKVRMHGKYPAVSVFKYKIHIHRLIMMFILRRKMPRNVHVHHINGNKLDASILNLQVISASAHISHTHKGRKVSESCRLKMIANGKRRKGIIMKKRKNINLIKLKKMLQKKISINKISQHFKVDWSTIRTRIRQNPELLEAKS